MGIINPDLIKMVVDNGDGTYSICERVPAGKTIDGDILYENNYTVVTAKEGEQLSRVLLKRDKSADALREGAKPMELERK